MQNFQRTFGMLLFAFLLTSQLKAQLPAIDSLRIMSQHPATSDSVKVISYSTFPSGGCEMISSVVNINEKIISVHVVHTIGMLTVICHSVDTLTIGKLEAGSYELRYYLTEADNLKIYDIDTICFTVESITGFQAEPRPIFKIKVLPNPFSLQTVLYTEDSFKDANVLVYNTYGQIVQQIRPVSGASIAIQRNNLPNGIYFVHLIQADKKSQITKVIISD